MLFNVNKVITTVKPTKETDIGRIKAFASKIHIVRIQHSLHLAGTGTRTNG